jgi:uncharacterized protein (TIGR00661 family)
MFDGARILVAPLDWGLGHAARCVPVIKALITHGAVPVIGADGGPLDLLRAEFPGLDYVRIPGMEVRYAKGRSQAWVLARQFPAMLRAVRGEQQLFDRLRKDLRPDAVISDQRFGIRADELPSVLITHQIFPFSPMAQGIVRRINRHHIDRFDRCWIPDHAIAPGLAGELSHGRHLPGAMHYIGPVSRFDNDEVRSHPEAYRVVAVISGPEPQRTLFERRVIKELLMIDGRHLVVSGTPGLKEERTDGNVRIVPHLQAKALRNALLGAELIVSRTGYTTLMDLYALGRSALLVPTPGQMEQEYLGTLHARIGGHVVQRQDGMDIRETLRCLPPPAMRPENADALAVALTDLAALIRGRIPATFTG